MAITIGPVSRYLCKEICSNQDSAGVKKLLVFEAVHDSEGSLARARRHK
jgi:hypothetical protein